MNHMAGRVAVAAILFGCLPNMALSQVERPRAREVGLEIGIFEPGRLNAITDVEGVKVGHRTIISPPNVLTGITAILPHSDNLYSSRVPAAIHVGNGFGKRNWKMDNAFCRHRDRGARSPRPPRRARRA